MITIPENLIGNSVPIREFCGVALRAGREVFALHGPRLVPGGSVSCREHQLPPQAKATVAKVNYSFHRQSPHSAEF